MTITFNRSVAITSSATEATFPHLPGAPAPFQSLTRDYLFCNSTPGNGAGNVRYLSIAHSRLPLLQLTDSLAKACSDYNFQSLTRDYLFCNSISF